MTEPYNPLSRQNLADSIEREILKSELVPLFALPSFQGAGVYALYYRGSLDIYQPLTATSGNPTPIYVGKAIPRGARIGGLREGDLRTTALMQRLRKHAGKINSTVDLSDKDFLVRYLVVDDIWIPLGENTLIDTYKPVWNRVVAGFGNNPLGSGRTGQKPSLWDVLHPPLSGGDFSKQPVTREEMRGRVADYLQGLSVPEVDSRDPYDEEESD